MFSAIKPFIELCRVSNLPTVWTNVLAAVVLAGRPFSWPLFLALSTSMSFFYSAGMCLNDIYDRDLDRTGKAFRPIPSGSILITHAWIATILLFITALCLLLPVPHKKALYAGVLLIAIIIIYNKSHKTHPLSVLLMAMCRFMVFAVSGIAVAGFAGPYVIIGGVAQFVYTLIISLVARYENNRIKPFAMPVIPVMIACMSLLDGVLMALFASPAWLLAGLGGAILTLYSQKYVRGD